MNLATRVEAETTSVSLATLHADRFPSADLVAASVSLLPKLPRWDGSEQIRRYYLEVSPGTVALRVRDVARRERTGNRDLGGFRMPSKYDRWDREAPHPDEVLYGQSRHLCIGDDLPPRWDRTPTRSIKEWSRRSRARMIERFAQLDYHPMLRLGDPAMGTLTYSGDWQTVAPNGRAVKRHLRLLFKRFAREYGRPLACLWKLEFQRRGAPHIHLFFVPPGTPEVTSRGYLRPDPAFAAWLSRTWADIVNHPDPLEYERHLRAGTAVDYAEASRYADPRRLAVYFAGHSSKSSDGKEYQHIVPQLWQAPGAGPGRFWGYYSIPRAVAYAEITHEQFLAARRALRREVRKRGRTKRVTVDRVDTRTGVIRRRTVTRRHKGFASGRLAGGWLVANDGPSMLADLVLGLPAFRT